MSDKPDVRALMEKASRQMGAISRMVDALPQGATWEEHLDIARSLVNIIERSGPRRGLVRFER